MFRDRKTKRIYILTNSKNKEEPANLNPVEEESRKHENIIVGSSLAGYQPEDVPSNIASPADMIVPEKATILCEDSQDVEMDTVINIDDLPDEEFDEPDETIIKVDNLPDVHRGYESSGVQPTVVPVYETWANGSATQSNFVGESFMGPSYYVSNQKEKSSVHVYQKPVERDLYGTKAEPQTPLWREHSYTPTPQQQKPIVKAQIQQKPKPKPVPVQHQSPHSRHSDSHLSSPPQQIKQKPQQKKQKKKPMLKEENKYQSPWERSCPFRTFLVLIILLVAVILAAAGTVTANLLNGFDF